MGTSSRAFSYANLANLSLIEEIYEIYLADPSKVDLSWRAFFDGVEFGEGKEGGPSKEQRILRVIEGYRRFGHLLAKINPIATHEVDSLPELSLKILGFEENELKASFPTMGLLEGASAPLEEIISALEGIYCGTIGVEYVGHTAPKLDQWLQGEIEGERPPNTLEQKTSLLQQLNRAELFERFLNRKYVGQKRFSLEGGETLIPMLNEIIEVGAEHGVDEFVLAMAHRGRLNVRANIMQEPLSALFAEFEDYFDPDQAGTEGDVKYHRGFSSDIVTSNGKKIHLALTANPSHLESVNSVALGKVRAKRQQRGKESIVPILIHGDASLAGQGVVCETMQLFRLGGYSVGGAIHIVVNNQIGFTTLPEEGRSTHYCTDLARGFSFPIFHVNAEDPEGCLYITRLAMEIYQKFHCDVFIDLNCYRRYGHNESDEPAFTQPLEYQKIESKSSIREIYRDKLVEQGFVEREAAEKLEREFQEELKSEFAELQEQKTAPVEKPFKGVWESYRTGDLFQPVKTAVDRPLLREMAARACQIPEGFAIHPKVGKLQETRLKMVEAEAQHPSIDWAFAEQLALASLLWEGRAVRFAGEDVQRGTFSQRHAAWVDQKSGKRYFPLSHLKESQGYFEIINSLLSEFAALGFEFGYSLCYPSALVVWEAQFGDFANGGQVIIDQYISSSEQKWQRCSGLVLLLPHGYEGQGSEHSSARVERFLQLAGNGNMQIVNPTTPAQYFHLLRRQVIRSIRRPLIVLTPKGLLRHPQCLSSLDELVSGSFQEFLDDPHGGEEADRLLLCSGRIYYDLIANRKESRTAIVRIEQLYPIHDEQLAELLQRYSKVKKVFWVQEEPKNMGGWSYILPILNKILPEQATLHYVGRNISGSPATGSHANHVREQQELMKMAFEVQS